MSTHERNTLRKLKRYSGRLNRMIEDGTFHDMPARKRSRLVRTVRGLYDSLLGVVSEASLRHILAAAAVVVLGVSACAQSTGPSPDTRTDTTADTSYDSAADTGFDTPFDTPYDTGLDTGTDTGIDTGADTPTDTGADTAVDTGIDTSIDTGVDTTTDTGVDTGTDTSTDTSTDPGSGIRFDTRRSNPFSFVGTYSYYTLPALADIDGDGDIDLFVGMYYYTTGGARIYYENTGTAGSPTFASGVVNPFGITTSGYAQAPALADLDGDGDVDLLVASYSYPAANFYYLENTGSATAPAFASPSANPFGLTSTSYYLNPLAFTDIDDDGDLDLFAGGDWWGRLDYYENTGSSTAPTFATPLGNHFGFTSSSYLAAPTFADLDDDGDRDLMVGTYDYVAYGDAFNYYQNTGSATAAALAAPLTNPFGLTGTGGWYLFPAFADMDDDGDQDLFAGSYGATLYYFENITP
jgi:hypothetical protein